MATAVAILLAVGCGGAEQRAEDTGAPPQTPPAQEPPPSGAAPTPQMIALGDSIFHGRAAGGNCFTCHGQNATGTQLGPNLADSQWIHGDGSYQFLVNTIMNGVTTPKQYPGVMLPRGGAPLTDDQVQAVAAYVDSKTP